MTKTTTLALCLCLSGFCFFIYGCGKKVDETKSISEIKSEVEEMSIKDLKLTAEKYKNSIAEKNKEVEKLTAKLKDIPVGELMGEKSKEIKDEIEKTGKSINALKERFNIYLEKLKEKGEDISVLKI